MQTSRGFRLEIGFGLSDCLAGEKKHLWLSEGGFRLHPDSCRHLKRKFVLLKLLYSRVSHVLHFPSDLQSIFLGLCLCFCGPHLQRFWFIVATLINLVSTQIGGLFCLDHTFNSQILKMLAQNTLFEAMNKNKVSKNSLVFIYTFLLSKKLHAEHPHSKWRIYYPFQC